MQVLLVLDAYKILQMEIIRPGVVIKAESSLCFWETLFALQIAESGLLAS